MKDLMTLANRLARTSILLFMLAATPFAAAHGQVEEETGVWLLTYGPGEVYWQRFGHNAIWIRDRELGLDHTFNFGFFDFEQENFFWRFLQGRMLYFSAAQSARDEFAVYVNEDREIRAQKLDLSAEQKLRLIEYLLDEVRPENRDYLYDYYRNNCSTRVRDALDLALGGGLRRDDVSGRAAEQSWRDHTRRLTYENFWLYLGLEIGLGSPVDREISGWDEMFIPAVLAEAVADLKRPAAAGDKPLVIEDVILHPSSRDPPASAPSSWWPRYLLAALGALIAAWLFGRLTGPGSVRVLARSWLVLNGLVGLALVFFWFGTDHSVARLNLNVLVFSPLYLPLAVWKGKGKLTLILVCGLSGLAMLMLALPPGQYTADVLAAFLPLNLAAAYRLRHE